MKPLFNLILISPEHDLKGEMEVLVQLFNFGITTYHLRKPDWCIEKTQRWLQQLPKDFHNLVVLHNHFVLANDFEIKGIHLNEEKRPFARQLSNYKIISASFHSVEDLKGNTFPYEYAFLSPVFDSISKAGYKGNFDLKLLKENLREMKQQNRSMPKVIGLGGVNAQNILSLKSAGFSGAGLLGSVWQNENPIKAFLEIQTLIANEV